MANGSGRIELIQRPYEHHDATLCMVPGTTDVVEIDDNILELIGLMWDAGITTNFSCEGYSIEGHDETEWETRELRAYVQMHRDERSLWLVKKLINDTHFFSADKVAWEISFDRNPHTQVNRICIRFPHQDIPQLEAYLSQWNQEASKKLTNLLFGRKNK